MSTRLGLLLILIAGMAQTGCRSCGERTGIFDRASRDRNSTTPTRMANGTDCPDDFSGRPVALGQPVSGIFPSSGISYPGSMPVYPSGNPIPLGSNPSSMNELPLPNIPPQQIPERPANPGEAIPQSNNQLPNPGTRSVSIPK